MAVSKYNTPEEYHKAMRLKSKAGYRDNSEVKKEYNKKYYIDNRKSILNKKQNRYNK